MEVERSVKAGGIGCVRVFPGWLLRYAQYRTISNHVLLKRNYIIQVGIFVSAFSYVLNNFVEVIVIYEVSRFIISLSLFICLLCIFQLLDLFMFSPLFTVGDSFNKFKCIMKGDEIYGD